MMNEFEAAPNPSDAKSRLVIQPDKGVETEAEYALDAALRDMRTRLNMDVAYLSQITGNTAVFRYVSAPGFETICRRGLAMDIREMYCSYILQGSLPTLIVDTSAHQVALDLPITQAVPIGCHISVPVHLENGEHFGMLCCLAHKPNPSLTERDVDVVRDVARSAVSHIKADGLR